jgi:hypothetical protein
MLRRYCLQQRISDFPIGNGASQYSFVHPENTTKDFRYSLELPNRTPPKNTDISSEIRLSAIIG